MEGGGIGREMEEFIKAVVSLRTLGECVSLPLCVGSHFKGFTDRQIPSADTHGHKREPASFLKCPKFLFLY